MLSVDFDFDFDFDFDSAFDCRFWLWLLFYSPPLHLGGVKLARADRLGLIWWGGCCFSLLTWL